MGGGCSRRGLGGGGCSRRGLGGGELFPEGSGWSKKRVKVAAAQAAVDELLKRGPLPGKVREGLKE